MRFALKLSKTLRNSRLFRAKSFQRIRGMIRERGERAILRVSRLYPENWNFLGRSGKQIAIEWLNKYINAALLFANCSGDQHMQNLHFLIGTALARWELSIETLVIALNKDRCYYDYSKLPELEKRTLLRLFWRKHAVMESCMNPAKLQFWLARFFSASTAFLAENLDRWNCLQAGVLRKMTLEYAAVFSTPENPEGMKEYIKMLLTVLTECREEWSGLSLSQQRFFLTSLFFSTHFLSDKGESVLPNSKP